MLQLLNHNVGEIAAVGLVHSKRVIGELTGQASSIKVRTSVDAWAPGAVTTANG